MVRYVNIDKLSTLDTCTITIFFDKIIFLISCFIYIFSSQLWSCHLAHLLYGTYLHTAQLAGLVLNTHPVSTSALGSLIRSSRWRKAAEGLCEAVSLMIPLRNRHVIKDLAMNFSACFPSIFPLCSLLCFQGILTPLTRVGRWNIRLLNNICYHSYHLPSVIYLTSGHPSMSPSARLCTHASFSRIMSGVGSLRGGLQIRYSNWPRVW